MEIYSKELNQKLKVIKPFISNSILDATDSVLIKDGYMYAVNDEFFVKQKINCGYVGDEDKSKDFLIPADTINTISSITDADITFKVQDSNTVRYTCLFKFRYRKFSNTYKHKDISLFPLKTFSFSGHKEISSFKINGTDLVKAFNKVLYAVDKRYLRPEFRGVHIQKDSSDTSISFVGCNGYRLAKYEIPFEDSSLTLNCTLLLEVADYICKVKPTDDVKVTVFDTYICFETEDFMVASHLCNEDYVSYKDYFTYDPKIVMTVDRVELRNSLSFSSKNAKVSESVTRVQKYRPAVLTFGYYDITLSSVLKDGGILEDRISILDSNSPDHNSEVKIEVDAKFLHEAVNSFDEDILILSAVDPTKPIFITAIAKLGDTDTVAQKAMIFPILNHNTIENHFKI